jgi:hypothetical protein
MIASVSLLVFGAMPLLVAGAPLTIPVAAMLATALIL